MTIDLPIPDADALHFGTYLFYQERDVPRDPETRVPISPTDAECMAAFTAFLTRQLSAGIAELQVRYPTDAAKQIKAEIDARREQLAALSRPGIRIVSGRG